MTTNPEKCYNINTKSRPLKPGQPSEVAVKEIAASCRKTGRLFLLGGNSTIAKPKGRRQSCSWTYPWAQRMGLQYSNINCTAWMASRIACIKSADISKNVISITSPYFRLRRAPIPRSYNLTHLHRCTLHFRGLTASLSKNSALCSLYYTTFFVK